MNWTAAHEQREDALLRVFYMLVATALLTIRAGMGSRRAAVFFPFQRISRNDARSIDNRLSPTEAYQAVVQLLLAAELAMRRLDAMTRALFELMNEFHTLAGSMRIQVRSPANQCSLPTERLDSS